MCIYLVTIISTVFLFYRVLVFIVRKQRPGVFVFVGLTFRNTQLTTMINGANSFDICFLQYINIHIGFDECCSMAFFGNRATTESRDPNFSHLIEANSP